MTTITIQCGCGQRYEFDVEPVDGRMPSTVACPFCGVDGTDAGNAAIAHSEAQKPSIRLATPTTQHAPRRTSPSPLTASKSHEQIQHEARAKILWGDAPEEVVKFVMMQGFNAQEATELVDELYQERAATIRSDGMKKIFTGIGLMLVPVIAWFVFSSMGVIPLKLFALTIMAGLYGLWVLVSGIIMFTSPKSIHGDASEQ